jgi:hypothetical protein
MYRNLFVIAFYGVVATAFVLFLMVTEVTLRHSGKPHSSPFLTVGFPGH